MKKLLIFALLISATVFTMNLQAQSKVVRGTVIEAATHWPMVGVQVVEKGTVNGTITDLDGKYYLPNCSRNCTIVYSYIGFITEERSAMNASITMDGYLIDVEMYEDTEMLGFKASKAPVAQKWTMVSHLTAE